MSRLPVGAADRARASVRVWDPAVRGLHWALAACVAIAWATTEWFVRWHQPIGWAAIAIVGFRVVWGFAGTRHARFTQFVRSPRATLAYLRLVLRGREPRYIGHNPLGACMVLALLGSVGAVALTGWLYTTDRFWGDETIEILHRAFAWAIVALAALHVAGVVLASLRHRENLVAAMFSGEKRASCEGDID